MATNKTAVSTLHELCVAHSCQPNYNLMDCDTVKLPQTSFKCELFLEIQGNTLRVQGIGHTKREAKHDSANNTIKQLAEMGISHKKDLPHPDAPKILRRDAVERLVHICDHQKLSAPKYDIHDTGPAHAREFGVICSINSLKTTAVGNSKKTAKNIAASSMIKLLTSLNVKTERKTPMETIEENDEVILTRRFEEYGSPFEKYDPYKCDECRDVLKDDSISLKEKTEKAFKALSIAFEVTETPGAKYKYVFETVRSTPQYCVAGVSHDDMYKQAIELLELLLDEK